MESIAKLCTCAFILFMRQYPGQAQLKAGHLHNAIASVKFQLELD